MKEAAAAVIEFNRDLLNIEPRPVCPMPIDEYQHLLKAVDEEMAELREAWGEEDVVAMVDAKIDAIYFLLGGLYKNGLTTDQIHACFMTVHSANMQKVRGRIASRAVGNAPDAIKPEGWLDPKVEIAKILGLAE